MENGYILAIIILATVFLFLLISAFWVYSKTLSINILKKYNQISISVFVVAFIPIVMLLCKNTIILISGVLALLIINLIVLLINPKSE